MENKRRLYIFSGVGAGLSVFMLVLLAFIPFPAGLEYPGLEVLTGDLNLFPEDLVLYYRSMRWLFILDSLFLLGWFISWTGLGVIVREHSRTAGFLTLAFGLGGALLDVTENSIIWSAMRRMMSGTSAGHNWVVPWQIIQQLSYWLPYLGAAIAAVWLWKSGGFEKVPAVIGTILAAAAAACLYIPGFSIFSSAWFLFWFGSLAVLFWRYFKKLSPRENQERKVVMAVERVKWIRFSLYAAVYFVEGAVLTYFTAFNTIYLRSYSLSYSLIGIVGGITLIPFILKIIIGLVSDRVSLFKRGHRKPYIIIGLLLQSAAFLLIPSFSPVEQFPVYLTLMILASLGMSTYDTTTDGLSIDTTPESDRGIVQGIMVGGRALSSVITAALMGVFSGRGQWPVVFYMIAGLGLLALVLAFFVEEKKDRSPEMQYTKEAFSSFKNKAFLLFLVLGVVYPLALYSAQGMVGAYLNEGFNIPLATVGLYTSVFGIGTILGGVVGGPLMKKIGERASILAALLLTAGVTLVLAAVPTAGVMWAVVFLFGVAFGYYETVYFAMGMDFSDPRIAAFMFAVIMAVGNFGIAGGQPLAGTLVDAAGFRVMFLVFGVIHLLALPAVFGIFRLRRKAEIEAA